MEAFTTMLIVGIESDNKKETAFTILLKSKVFEKRPQ